MASAEAEAAEASAATEEEFMKVLDEMDKICNGDTDADSSAAGGDPGAGSTDSREVSPAASSNSAAAATDHLADDDCGPGSCGSSGGGGGGVGFGLGVFEAAAGVARRDPQGRREVSAPCWRPKVSVMH